MVRCPPLIRFAHLVGVPVSHVVVVDVCCVCTCFGGYVGNCHTVGVVVVLVDVCVSMYGVIGCGSCRNCSCRCGGLLTVVVR